MSIFTDQCLCLELSSFSFRFSSIFLCFPLSFLICVFFLASCFKRCLSCESPAFLYFSQRATCGLTVGMLAFPSKRISRMMECEFKSCSGLVSGFSICLFLRLIIAGYVRSFWGRSSEVMSDTSALMCDGF